MTVVKPSAFFSTAVAVTLPTSVVCEIYASLSYVAPRSRSGATRVVEVTQDIVEPTGTGVATPTRKWCTTSHSFAIRVTPRPSLTTPMARRGKKRWTVSHKPLNSPSVIAMASQTLFSPKAKKLSKNGTFRISSKLFRSRSEKKNLSRSESFDILTWETVSAGSKMKSVKTARRYNPRQRYYEVDNFVNPERDNNTESQLFDLYPGRPYPITEIIDRNLLPPEDPVLSRRAFLENRRKTDEYEATFQTMVRSMGGGDEAKVMVRPAVDPSEINEDPDQKYVVQKGMFGVAEHPTLVPPPIGPSMVPDGPTPQQVMQESSARESFTTNGSSARENFTRSGSKSSKFSNAKKGKKAKTRRLPRTHPGSVCGRSFFGMCCFGDALNFSQEPEIFFV